MAKVAINGLGRIGRATLKHIRQRSGLEVVAINDLIPVDNLAYLLKYDSVYGRWPGEEVRHGEGTLILDGREIPVSAEEDPAKLPWQRLGVDLVFECSGAFRRRAELEKHLEAGARHALLSAPEKTGEVPTVVFGVNTPERPPRALSCASCTTNCVAPVAEVMMRRFGVAKAILTTVHAYTSSQTLVDGPRKKWRRGRAGAVNFVPTSTGAGKVTALAVPSYEGIFDGIAVRGPVPVGSLADIVFLTRRRVSVQEVNQVFREESGSERYRGILGVSEDPIVSSDVVQDDRASIVDLTMTQVVDGDLVKVLSWYDNEWGYSAQMVRTAAYLLGLPAAG